MKSIALMNLNWLDYVVIGIIGLSILISLFRGFLREAISLLTWIVAILVGLKYSVPMSSLLENHISSVPMRYGVTFIGLFFLVMIVGLMVNIIVKLTVEKIGISFADRALGVLFGAARGVLLVSILLFLLNVSALQNEKWVNGSILAPYFATQVSWLNRYLPQQIMQVTQWMSNNVKTITFEYQKAVPYVRNSGNPSQSGR